MKLNRIKAVLVDKDLSQKWLSEQIGKVSVQQMRIVVIVSSPI